MISLNECPICTGKRFAKQFDFIDPLRKKGWHVSTCYGCTGGFINPQPTWAELDPYYSDTYSPYCESHAAWDADDHVVKEAVQMGVFREVPIVAGSRILDVGCGGGYFLRIATKAGAQVHGIEPSERGVATCQAAGLSVFHGTVETYFSAYPHERFDIVCASHVLEHVPNPITVLDKMRQLLKKTGKIVIIVPNAGCWAAHSLRGHWHSSDLPRHLMQFTPKSLEICGIKAGLTVEEIHTTSLPKSVASSLRIWMRRKFLIPHRITRKIAGIDRVWAPSLAKRLDKKRGGEAIVVTFRASS